MIKGYENTTRDRDIRRDEVTGRDKESDKSAQTVANDQNVLDTVLSANREQQCDKLMWCRNEGVVVL